MKRLQNCDSCRDCEEDCCCADVGFEACIVEVVECRVLGSLGFGWKTPPPCILARAAGRPLRYCVRLATCENETHQRIHTSVDAARECSEESGRFTRHEWAGDDASAFGECLPELCLSIYAVGGGEDGLELLARCFACPDACEECPSPSSPGSPGTESPPGSSPSSSSSPSGGECSCYVSLSAHAFGGCVPVEEGGTGAVDIFYSAGVGFIGCADGDPSGSWNVNGSGARNGVLRIDPCAPGHVDVVAVWTSSDGMMSCSDTVTVAI